MIMGNNIQAQKISWKKQTAATHIKFRTVKLTESMVEGLMKVIEYKRVCFNMWPNKEWILQKQNILVRCFDSI